MADELDDELDPDSNERQPAQIARPSAGSQIPPVMLRGLGAPAPSPTPAPGSTEDLEQHASASRIAPRPIASPSPIEAKTTADQAELGRLQSTGSGVSQIARAHPFAGGILRGLNAAGEIATAFSPQARPILNAIPGTEEHHNQLIRQQTGRIGEDLGEQKEQGAIGEAGARTEQAAAAAEKDTADAAKLREEAAVAGNPKQGLTPEEVTIHDLMTGNNGQPRVDPETQQPYTYFGAYNAVMQAKAGAKPEPTVAAHINYDAGIPVSVTGPDKKTYDINDPNLPPALKPLVDSANRAHGQHVKEQKDVAASGQAATADRQTKSEDFQKQEKGREHITKIESDYQDAASKAELIRDSIAQAQAGNKIAASFQGMLATLGITTMEGVKRINAVELGIPTGAGSLWDKARGKLGKWTAGQPMDADLQKDLSQLADTIQQASYKKYSSEHGRISKRYGLTDEEPLPAPGGGGAQTGAQGGTHQTPAIGTIEGGYKFKGGDPSHQSSWEKVVAK
jgi:hypothetical protein